MGIDPATKEPVLFDAADPKFMKAYFEILHHPEEERGIAFWWIDWQQEKATKLEGLDPLFALNHLHFNDLGRDKSKRPFTFSRWGGYGSHRYPIGFSGDAIVTWESLAFQPYFTATASNVGYGWWSHDIGGHMRGFKDGELFARWVQFGIFSPIMRLRHRLVPYIYTMAYRHSTEDIPLIVPMYYHHPDNPQAYMSKNQYYFGSELIAAPLVTPIDRDLGVAKNTVWLPEGEWFDFFTGEHHNGGKLLTYYGHLEDIPVFAKAGAIVPLSRDEEVAGSESKDATGLSATNLGATGLGPQNLCTTANPTNLDILVFPGADNTFDLYEDDGESQYYKDGAYWITRIEQQWYVGKGEKHGAEIKIIVQSFATSIQKPSEESGGKNPPFLPERRKVTFTVRGFSPEEKTGHPDILVEKGPLSQDDIIEKYEKQLIALKETLEGKSSLHQKLTEGEKT